MMPFVFCLHLTSLFLNLICTLVVRNIVINMFTDKPLDRELERARAHNG